MTVSADHRGDTLVKGTGDILFLKEGAQEFSPTDIMRKKLKNIQN